MIERLTGGRLSSGVFRSGNEVHRPRSDFAASVLTLLESRGFRGAPRFLRRTGETDVLSFVPGHVPPRFRPWSDAQVEQRPCCCWRCTTPRGAATWLDHQARQVRLIAEAYGLEVAERHALVDCVLERQSRNVRFWTSHAAPADVLTDRIEWSRREHAFVHLHRDVLDRELA